MTCHLSHSVIALALAVFMIGCGQTGLPDTDMAAEAQAIRELDGALTEAAQTQDALAFAAFFAEDAVQMPPNAPRLEGRFAIQESASGLFAAGADLRFETLEVRVSSSGDMATSLGKYFLTMDSPGGAIKDEGSYVEVWQRVEGEWKITADIYNSDLPIQGGGG